MRNQIYTLNVNVNVHGYRLYNLHPWYWNTLFYCLISSGDNSAFADICCSYIQSFQFSFLVLPGTHHCYVDRASVIWEACPTPLHMAGSVTRVVVTHPSTNRAQRCLTSVTLGGIGDTTIYSPVIWALANFEYTGWIVRKLSAPYLALETHRSSLNL